MVTLRSLFVQRRAPLTSTLDLEQTSSAAAYYRGKPQVLLFSEQVCPRTFPSLWFHSKGENKHKARGDQTDIIFHLRKHGGEKVQ